MKSKALRRLLLGLGALLYGSGVHAERQPVLGQIDLPHPYYYRELYLPQLTAGPSALAWSADGTQLIYSMQGSLWRQTLGRGEAQQLTAGEGYDYQPDASPNGRWVIYSTYHDAAVELRVLDLASGRSQVLLANGAVNVEPRFSPDGSHVAFVSTAYHRRFHIFVAAFADGRLTDLRRLTGESRSPLPRYYYSAFDHEISPVWSRDGREILFVSNRNHIYGTGGLWRIAADAAVPPDSDAPAGTAAREIHYEETNWKARPELSPDGGRLVYSSYQGRSWHNLWLLPAQGGDAFPLAYGDYDQTNARWSPDGKRIAFISNRDGATAIALVEVPGGRIETLPAAQRQYLRHMARLDLHLADGAAAGSARVSVTGADGRFYAPGDAWIHADDGIDRRQAPFEAHYFHASGSVTLDVPEGTVRVDVMHGFERRFEQREVRTVAGHGTRLDIDLAAGALRVPDAARWASADVHVHMNYGGTYRNTPAHLAQQAEAEHLDFVNALTVNKEQRFPDIAYNGEQRDPASTPHALILHGQEYHTSYWGHLGLLGIEGGLILPGYVGYPNTAAASLLPMNADVADMAHARHALVGYVHPYDTYPEPLKRPAEALTSELPVDVALGKVDYVEILGFADPRFTAAVWYQLLNLGFRIPAAGGTDAMANYASLRGPVGMNRAFARVSPDNLQAADWLAALKAGRTFATNGPLLGLSLDQAAIGDTLPVAPHAAVHFSARLESLVAVDHLELVCNGRVVRSFAGRHGLMHGEFTGVFSPADSGWCVLRASTDGARYPVLDNYVYATTSPVYVQVGGSQASSPADARYFVAWIERMIEATAAYPDWNTPSERQTALQRLEDAKAHFRAME